MPTKTVKKKKTSQSNNNKMTEKEVCDKVISFLQSNSRPYNMIELETSFHKNIPKKKILEAIEYGVSKKLVIAKEYGKSFLYLGVPSIPEDVNVDVINENIKSHKELNSQLKLKLSELEATTKKFMSIPDDQEVIKKVEEWKVYLEKSKRKLEDLENSKNAVTKEQSDLLVNDIRKYEKILKDRKDIFKNLVSSLMEAMSLSKEELYEEIGL